MMTVIYRVARAGDDAFIRSYRKWDYIIDEFQAVWSRWKEWDDNPPYLAVDGDVLAGFCGYKVTKTGSLNLVTIWVHDDYRKQGVATQLLNYMLADGQRRGALRLRLSCYKDPPDSYNFWCHYGLQPCGETEKEFIFDLDVEGITNTGLLEDYAPGLCDDVTTNRYTLTYHKRKGVRYTHPGWVHLNDKT